MNARQVLLLLAGGMLLFPVGVLLGYVLAIANRDSDWASGLDALESAINKDQPPSMVGQVIIVGNTRLSDHAIRRELTFYPGQRLYRWRLRFSEDRLKQTRFVQSCSISLLDEDGQFEDILVEIVEFPESE